MHQTGHRRRPHRRRARSSAAWRARSARARCTRPGSAFEAELVVDEPVLRGARLFARRGRRRALVRFSRGFGLPEPVPELMSMAIKVPDAYGPGRDQDLLWPPPAGGRSCATSSPGAATHLDRAYSTVLPFRVGERTMVLGAAPRRRHAGAPATCRARGGGRGRRARLRPARRDALGPVAHGRAPRGRPAPARRRGGGARVQLVERRRRHRAGRASSTACATRRTTPRRTDARRRDGGRPPMAWDDAMSVLDGWRRPRACSWCPYLHPGISLTPVEAQLAVERPRGGVVRARHPRDGDRAAALDVHRGGLDARARSERGLSVVQGGAARRRLRRRRRRSGA